MKIVQIIGGLGNQMFQYAFYKALQSHYKDVEIDTSLFSCYKLHNGFELAKIFGVQFKEASLLKRMQLSFHGGDILSRILKKVIQQRNTECNLQHRSWWFDFKILVKTFINICFGKKF